MEFVKLAHVDDFAEKRFRAYFLMARRVGIFKESDGSFYAIEMTCKHAGGDLSRGRFDGDMVTCPRHAWRYHVKTGECDQAGTPPLRRHALRIEDGEIHISRYPVEPGEEMASWQ